MALLAACGGTSAPAQDSAELVDLVDVTPDTGVTDTSSEDPQSDDTLSEDTLLQDTSDTSVEADLAEELPDGSSETEDTSPTSAPRCIPHDPEFIAIPEASGAAPLDATHILVVADSGHSGRALVIAHDGASKPLTLPLGEGAGDDVEGLTRSPDGLFYGLTSSGYLRVWRIEMTDDAWSATLLYGPTPIAEQGEWVGGPRQVNAAANFEGICLHPAPLPGHCVGWAASKARGELVCLRAAEDPSDARPAAVALGLRLDPLVRVPVFDAEHLSDCAYEDTPPHRLFAAGNIYSNDRIREVRPEGLALEIPSFELDPNEAGAPNQEAILVRGRPGGFEIHSFGDWQDLGGDQSPRVVFTCAP